MANNVESALARFRELSDEIRKLDENLNLKMSEKNLAGAEAQQFVRSGQTTGNRIVDFVLARDGAQYSKKRVEGYCALQTMIHGQKGQMVLIVTKQNPFLAHSANKGGETIFCGLLSGDALILDPKATPPRCELPFKHYVYENRTSFRLLDGGVREGWMEEMPQVGPFLLKCLDPKEYYPGYEHCVADIYIGESGIKKWFAENRADTDRFADISEILRGGGKKVAVAA